MAETWCMLAIKLTCEIFTATCHFSFKLLFFKHSGAFWNDERGTLQRPRSGVENNLIWMLTEFSGLPDTFFDGLLLSLIISGRATISGSVYQQKSSFIVKRFQRAVAACSWVKSTETLPSDTNPSYSNLALVWNDGRSFIYSDYWDMMDIC